MANATEPTKRTAVWKPPRLRELNLGMVESGTKGSPQGTQYEGATQWPPVGPPGGSNSAGYRAPTSGEVPVPFPYPWQ